MQSHDEDVVEDEGEGGELVGDLVLAKDLVANVADVEQMRVAQAVPPQDERGVERGETDAKGSDQSTGHAEVAECPRERQNGETDVFGEEEHRRLLPRKRSIDNGTALLCLLDTGSLEGFVRVCVAADLDEVVPGLAVLGLERLWGAFEVVC